MHGSMNAKSLISLRDAARALLEATAQDQARCAIGMADLEQLVHDAEAAAHRRAAFNAIDRAKYRLGSAFEVNEALDLDPITLAGWLAGGSAALLLLVRVALANPDRSIASSLRSLFLSPAGPVLRELGVWASWQRLKALYVEEVEAVQASSFGQNPNHSSRRKPPTIKQNYLASEICRALQIEPRSFRTRGETYEWLLAQGGNPRFWSEPPRPDFDALFGDLP